MRKWISASDMRIPAIAIVMLVASASRSSFVVNSYDTVGSRKYAHAALSVSRTRSSKYRTASLLRALDALLIDGSPIVVHDSGDLVRRPSAPLPGPRSTGDLLPWVTVG